MAKRNVSPIMTWIFWGIVVFGAFLYVTWDYFAPGFSTDTSKITWIITAFFILGWWYSLRAAIHLTKESKSLRDMNTDQRLGDPNSSDIAALFDSTMERIRRGDRIEPRNLILAYGAKLRAQTENVSVISGILITSGLLGTVVGLIITISGLDTVLQSNSADFSTMKMGLNRTVSGMGTAFTTTFFGGLLGGVVLKALGAELKKSVAIQIADALRFSELFIAPQFAKKSSESLVELETRIGGLQQQMGSLGDSFGAMIETLDSKQTALATGLGGLVSAVADANSETAERTKSLVDAVDRKVEETNRLADERLRAIVESVSRSNEEAGARLEALVGSINQSVESTNRMADERLAALTTSIAQANGEAHERAETLVKAVDESIGATNQLADERLKMIAATIEQANGHAEERMIAIMERMGLVVDESHDKASERISVLSDAVNRTVEETHRLADERLQMLLKAVEAAADNTHQKSEAHLVSFVESIDQSIDKSRKEAERSLDAKASNLASKLSEAAMVLSSLVTSPDVAIENEQAPGEGE